MSGNTVELTLEGHDKGASSVIKGLMGNLMQLQSQFMAMAGLAAGAGGLGALVKQSIDFNKTMESSKSGIASLVLANNVLSDSFGKALGPAASLNQAFKIAEGVQGDLRKAALTTAASYQELVKGFQTAYGPATAAGITSMSKIKEITVTASQAVAALGLDSRQTSQELRALFTGEQGPDNTLTRTLGITKAEIDKVKASGQDFGDFLIQKLKPFADVAGASLGNFSTVVSNLGDAMDQISGEAFAPLFREIKAQAGGMGGALGGFREGLGAIGQGLADTLRALGPLVQAVAGLGVTAVRAGTDFLTAFAPIVPALTAITGATAGLVDSLGTVGLTVLAGGMAFSKLSALASAGLYKIIGATAATDVAVTALIGTISLATLGWVALGAAVATAIGYLIKWNYESKADEAWERAATAQQTFIEVLERRYKKTIDITASEELLNMAQSPPLSMTEARGWPRGQSAIAARYPGSFFLFHGPEGPGIYRKSRTKTGNWKTQKQGYKGGTRGIERIAAARRQINQRGYHFGRWRSEWMPDLVSVAQRFIISGQLPAAPSSGGSPDKGPRGGQIG